ncbi:MAG: response regulator [Chloroflexaceae bacterium]|nr:response regulator [Chloroflexaceae bacterium]
MVRTPQTILIGDDDRQFCQLMTVLLVEAGFAVLVAHDGHTLVRLAQDRLPDLILIDLVMPHLDGYEALRQLRNDTRTAHLPMIIVSVRAAPRDLVKGFESGADDFVTKPVIGTELVARIRGHLRRAARQPVHSPLTGLPGNTLLLGEIRQHLRQRVAFTLLHADLGNFKAFNDFYGFSRGDTAIRELAGVLREVTHREAGVTFLGHIGGDDFAILCSPEQTRAMCRDIIARFESLVPKLYEGEELARGYLEARDRDGAWRRFPLMGLAIGGGVHHAGRVHDAEDLSRQAASMKLVAKRYRRSAYAVDPADGSPYWVGP